MDIGKVIQQIRISKNLKQTAVAASVGISVTAYSDIERGKTNHITLLRLEQIGQRAGIDAGDGNERQQPEQHQRTEGEPQALLELGGLGEAGERNIAGQLFGCGCH